MILLQVRPSIVLSKLYYYVTPYRIILPYRVILSNYNRILLRQCISILLLYNMLRYYYVGGKVLERFCAGKFAYY